MKWFGQLNTLNGGGEGEPVIGDVDGDGGNERSGAWEQRGTFCI